jgi:alkylhydroperoxidase family enzyme
MRSSKRKRRVCQRNSPVIRTSYSYYCIASHSAAARAKGMTDAQFSELVAVIGLANETNRLAIGYDVPVDAQFKSPR